ncbi:MAG: ATP-binding protein [Ignavibacteriae bacterium]|nr:ATP-binding protein [Ignavibacteriota bacterium]
MENIAKISIKSSTKNLIEVRNFIETNAKKQLSDANIINQIILSVDEACTNIIKHTYKFDESHIIEIQNYTDKNQFVVKIFYSGDEFDPNKRNNPDMKEYFAKYKVGGLGIPLMKKFMDKIDYMHYVNNFNELTLVKNI